MATAKKRDKEKNIANYAVVGELVLMSTTLDWLLNRVLIAVLHLGSSVLLEPVVATMDTARKLEILKSRAKHIHKDDWKKGILKFCDQVDSVFKQRNIACHTPATSKDGGLIFKPIAAAKLLKKLDIKTQGLPSTHLDDFKSAIKTGEAALGAGLDLIENFDRVNAEIERRAALKLKIS